MPQMEISARIAARFQNLQKQGSWIVSSHCPCGNWRLRAGDSLARPAASSCAMVDHDRPISRCIQDGAHEPDHADDPWHVQSHAGRPGLSQNLPGLTQTCAPFPRICSVRSWAPEPSSLPMAIACFSQRKLPDTSTLTCFGITCTGFQTSTQIIASLLHHAFCKHCLACEWQGAEKEGVKRIKRFMAEPSG